MTSTGKPDAAAAPDLEPCLSAWQQQNLADALLAIGGAIASEPEAEAHSLRHWLTWLDEEGYDADGLVEALKTLGQQRLAPEAWQQLQTHARDSAETPNGVANAIAQLSGAHPELLDEILEMEQSRQQELETIHTTAGGMKKWGKDALIGGAIYVGIGIAGNLTAYSVQQRRRRAQELVNDARDNFYDTDRDKKRLLQNRREGLDYQLQ